MSERCCEHPTSWPHHAEGVGCLHEGCPCTYRLEPLAPNPPNLPPHVPVDVRRPKKEYL